MNEARKRAAEFISEYKTITERKRIIEEQMFAIASLLRELNRENSSTGNTSEHAIEYEEHLRSTLSSLNVRRGALRLRLNMINSILDGLKPDEREILNCFYVDGDSRRASDRLIEKLGFEKSHIYRLKDKALDKVALLIQAFEEEHLYDKFCEQTAEDCTEQHNCNC